MTIAAQIKQGMFTLLFHYRYFFNLTYKPLLGLSVIGMGIAGVLWFDAYYNAASYVGVGSLCGVFWLAAIRFVYPVLLSWCDQRHQPSCVVTLHPHHRR